MLLKLLKLTFKLFQSLLLEVEIWVSIKALLLPSVTIAITLV